MIEEKDCPIDNVEEHCETLLETMKDIQEYSKKNQFKNLTKLLKAIVNEYRLQILMLLQDKQRCFCELEFALDIAQPTISYHVKALEGVGLITSEKQGKSTFFSISNPAILSNFLTLISKL